MKIGTLLGCLTVSAFGFAIALLKIYCSGRWRQLTLVAEELDGEIVGLMVGMLGCAVVLLIFKEKGRWRKFIVYSLTFVLVIISYFWGHKLMLPAYALGLKHSIFSIASEAQWDSTLLVAEKYQMKPHEKQELDFSMFPDFVQKLCPGRFLYCSICEQLPTTNNLHLMFRWDGGNFDTGIEIGPMTPEVRRPFENMIYREEYSTNIAVILVR